MKVILLIFVLGLSSACSTSIAVSKSAPKTTPTIANSGYSDANNSRPLPNESEKIDKGQRLELEKKNKEFEEKPPEFEKVDLANFQFTNPLAREYRQKPSVRLIEGKLEYEDREHTGGTTYSLGGVYYVDLAGDSRKEAVVFLHVVSCGGSCDGGSSFIYFYAANRSNPKLLGVITTGSRAYGCSLKSLMITGKKITIEQFGRCSKKSWDIDSFDATDVAGCKFCMKDLTKSVYVFNNTKLIRSSLEIIESSVTNVNGYWSEISIDN